MGVTATRVSKPEELESKLQWLLDQEGPCLLEVVIDQKVPVLPMVPGGNGLHEFLVYDEGKPKISAHEVVPQILIST
jgi:acetolactate synthase-1/2/3 large subunit